MKPRHTADYRVLLWALLMPAVALLPYVKPSVAPWSLFLSCYFALCAGVIAHGHNHCPTFHSRPVNRWFGNWLSIFYGYPTFAWIPTHNLNHHKFVNKEGDATITWRYSKKNNFWVAGTYFFVSSYWQSDPTKAYIRNAKANHPKLYRQILGQYAFFVGTHLLLLSLAIWLHGFGQGLWVWLAGFGIPAVFALWTIMFFNYIQHVHADPWSEHNHSRTFYGGVMNALLFNNGLHTVHHENPGAHWSALPKLHAKIHNEIDPRLNHSNFGLWLIRTYVLALFHPRFGTEQVGRAAYDPPPPPAKAVPSAQPSASVSSLAADGLS